MPKYQSWILKHQLFILLAMVISFQTTVGLLYGLQIKAEDNMNYKLSNDKIACLITVEEGTLTSEKIIMQEKWIQQVGRDVAGLETDGDFAVELMWTGWLAPGKVNNADNYMKLTKDDFRLTHHQFTSLEDEGKKLDLYFHSDEANLELLLTYLLDPDAFYVHRKIALLDTTNSGHFVHWIWARYGEIFNKVTVIKNGGFGQPIAIESDDGGAFFGVEYPAAENYIEYGDLGNLAISCGQEVGKKIGDTWLASAWVVSALTPDHHVARWFDKYLDDIRVAPLKPFLLYNTWYDVRSPEYTDKPEDVMNETNLLRIIGDFQREMVEERKLKLDAFVLDDAWDIYKSDWELRKAEFPNGLQPITAALANMDAKLGIWFGPIGGYSYRNWRVDWMKEHGYEVVGDQLCLAGKNYHRLFKKRVLDFVRQNDVAYFKWDGIQFSCSEPGHGHPVGIYSRRAVMDSVIDLCTAVREENPNIFLNITSGTWLSPWWLQYTNTIWMQGLDYGYANIPSISRRDAAISYRDFVLYEDFGKNDFWFPIANLMTHGIIKGHLQKLGGEDEPLDKFTDNAILYVARGVAMWELYISPNLLTDGEWNALAKSIGWAKDRFDVLRHTVMIGGDPGEEQAYGYAHFMGEYGIIAIRNPGIEPKKLVIDLEPDYGLDPTATSLIFERVYPTRKISPELFAAGATIEVQLDGYETAIYELYPLRQATVPLLAGVIFEEQPAEANVYAVNIYNAGDDVRILNPEVIQTITCQGNTIPFHEFLIEKTPSQPPVTDEVFIMDTHTKANVRFMLHQQFSHANLSVLLRADQEAKNRQLPKMTITLNDKKVIAKIEQQEGQWLWCTVPVTAGKHEAHIQLEAAAKKQRWTGVISAWIIGQEKQAGTAISFELKQEWATRPMPPMPWSEGEARQTIKLGEAEVTVE